MLTNDSTLTGGERLLSPKESPSAHHCRAPLYGACRAEVIFQSRYPFRRVAGVGQKALSQNGSLIASEQRHERSVADFHLPS